jgi:hypothetical protein
MKRIIVGDCYRNRYIGYSIIVKDVKAGEIMIERSQLVGPIIGGINVEDCWRNH